MSWLVFAILAALFKTARGGFSKAGARDLDSYFVAWSLIAMSVPALLVPVIPVGIPPLGTAFWYTLLIGSVIDIAGSLFYVRAVDKSELSTTLPLLSFTPLFLLLLSPVINQEWPTRMGLLGVLVVVAGTYILRIDRLGNGLLAPLHAVAKDSGSRYMLATTFL